MLTQRNCSYKRKSTCNIHVIAVKHVYYLQCDSLKMIAYLKRFNKLCAACIGGHWIRNGKFV